MKFLGTSGDDSFSGGRGDDVFKMQQGGDDTVQGGAGSDFFVFGAAFTAADHVDGGKGDDILVLDGDYQSGITFAAGMLQEVENIQLAAKHDYTFTFDVTGTQSLTVDGSALGALDTLYAYAGNAVGGRFVLIGGRANDTLTGGPGKDTLTGGGGGDGLQGNGGSDTFVYQAVSDSTGVAFDTDVGFTKGLDLFRMPFIVAGVDRMIHHGFLNATGNASFNAELEAVIGRHHLLAGHAVVFHPDSGFWGGSNFLIVDANGHAGYQADEDFVIRIGGKHLDQISVADFTT